jgi:hypothetical protein
MRVDPREIIAGIPALQVRRLLRMLHNSWRTTSVQAILGIGRDRARLLVGELSRRGLIQKHRVGKGWYWGKTLSGGAFASATAAPAMSRAKAEVLLGKFLDRVGEVNSNPEYLYGVERVDVFGSYLTESELLNDLDVAIAIRQKLDDADAHRVACDAQSRAAEASGRRFDWLTFDAWPEEKVLLYLKSRSRGLSVHFVSELADIN